MPRTRRQLEAAAAEAEAWLVRWTRPPPQQKTPGISAGSVLPLPMWPTPNTNLLRRSEPEIMAVAGLKSP